MTDEPATETEIAPEATPLLDMLDLHAAVEVAEPDVTFTDGDLTVTGTNAQDGEADLDSLCAVAAAVLRAEGVSEGRLDIHLVDDETITELNAEHMDGSGPTDVLAFPLDSEESGSTDFVETPGETPMLGDVVVCPAVAERQAPDHAGTLDAELILLVVHGVLHVLGHDHLDEAERLEMQGRERHHLEQLGFDHPVSPA